MDTYVAGGKGASLGEMAQAGIPVPNGFVVVASAFDRFIDETNLDEEIDARLKEAQVDDINSIDRASNIIRDVIRDTQIPEYIAVEILQSYSEMGEEFVAVRSSATAEDGSIASWAGELETFLNITRDELLEKVKECWSSLFTPRAIFYRFEKGLRDDAVSVAVVIQKMIQSEVSGVLFTVHPVTEDRNQMIIEAGLGLGEAIVSGEITPDSYVVSKKEMTILDININPQTLKLVMADKKRDIASINQWVDCCVHGMDQKLTNEQIIELAALAKKIEAHYGFPCDIEWAYAGGQFYITQSRPITTLYKSAPKH